MTTLPIVLLLVFLTATLSGTLGMGGGMILMGGLILLLPVATAFVWHGAVQLAANGSRAWIHREHIETSMIGGYAVGTAVALAIFASLHIVAQAWIVFLLLGLSPFLRMVPGLRITVETRKGQFVCGLVVTAAHLLAGASGPLLDVFYLGTRFSKQQIVANKAVTQAMGHGIKIVYYATLTSAWADIGEGGPLLLAMFIAVMGTWLGKRILAGMSENSFRHWTSGLTMFIGLVFLGRALMLVF